MPALKFEFEAIVIDTVEVLLGVLVSVRKRIVPEVAASTFDTWVTGLVPEVVVTMVVIVPLGHNPVASVHVVEQLWSEIESGDEVFTDCDIPKEFTWIAPLLLTEKKDW